MPTKTKSTAKTTTRSTKEPAMKTIPSIDAVKTLTGQPLVAAFALVFGEAPKPRTPVPTLRKRILAELERRAAETTPAVDTAAVTAIHTAAAEAVSDPDAEIEAAHEAAMKAAREAVERGADTGACSDAVAAYAAGAIDQAEFKARLEAAVPVASDVAVDAPATDPAPDTVGASEDAPVANADASDAPRPEPPAEPDIRDQILARARALDPATQRSFFEGFDKKQLLLLLERATGTKPSGRLSPAVAVDRLLAAVAPPPPAEIDTTPPATPAADKPATKSTRGRAAELPAVGTVLQNLDRHGAVRASCTVVEGGVEYAGQKYTSLSAAAIAASRALGNTTKQTSGPRFWGLVDAKPREPKAGKALDLDVLGRAWDRYRERAEAAAKDASAEDKAKLHALLAGHSTALATLSAAVA